jgi:FAD binding domain
VVTWDDEVDMVCTGSGAPGLACAVAVVDWGGTVFMADPSGEAAALRTRLGVGVPDAETNHYFAELTSDLGPLRRSSCDPAVPVRAVHHHGPVESGRTVAPFVGSRLRDWAARCLSTPYGYLYTRLSGWPVTTVHTMDGDVIEVAEIGTMTPDPDDVGGSILDWLSTQVHDRDIELNPNSTLQRIVFEEGVAVGAVFTTSNGPLAVRARHGVMVATGAAPPSMLAAGRLPAGAAVRICLTGQHASRFGRLEVLTSESSFPSPVLPTCSGATRQLRVNLHESHDRSPAWRCGKVHGYPSVGQ